MCMCVCVNFQEKQTTFTFSAQIFPINGFKVGNSKNRITISILNIPCVPIFSQNEQL